MLNPIYKVALQKSELNKEAMIEIISNLEDTQQTVAINILLGLYEKPEIPTTPCDKFYENNTSIQNAVFVNYNPLTDEVKYTGEKIDRVTVWVPQVEDNFELTYDTVIKDFKKYITGFSFDSAKRQAGMDMSIPESEYRKVVLTKPSGRTYTDNCSLSSWRG